MNGLHGDVSRCGVLAAGNWIVDHVKIVDTWPAQDALATIVSQSDGNGGGPYNMLKNLAKMNCGFPLSGIGLIGRDADAECILRDCAAHDIDRSGLHQTEAAPTSYTDVMTVAGSGRRTFFHQHGANALLNLEHFDLPKSRARIFYLGYLCLLKKLDTLDKEGRTGASRLLEQACRHGFMTVADLVSSETSDFPAVVNPNLPHLDFLFLNEYELDRLVIPHRSNTRNDPAHLEAQAREVLDLGVRRAVVVHFPEGAICVTPREPMVCQSSIRMPRDLIRGAAGAGDAFGAGFIYGLHAGWEMQRCLELGVCVAAASLRDATCSASIEPVENCLQFGRRLGFNELFALS
jgi:sugar/nucleoside kinase (ribokinase family)